MAIYIWIVYLSVLREKSRERERRRQESKQASQLASNKANVIFWFEKNRDKPECHKSQSRSFIPDSSWLCVCASPTWRQWHISSYPASRGYLWARSRDQSTHLNFYLFIFSSILCSLVFQMTFFPWKKKVSPLFFVIYDSISTLVWILCGSKTHPPCQWPFFFLPQFRQKK